MTGKRQVPQQSSSDGVPDISEVHSLLRDSIQVDREQLPEADGQFSLVEPRKHLLRAGGPLPHPKDVRAVLKQALKTLEPLRKRPEIRFLRMALSRHLELALSLDQAFGYSRTSKGAPPYDRDRARRIACAVFKYRFIDGLKAEMAGYQAGKRFRVKKTQALAAFTANDGYALIAFRAKRQADKRDPIWTPKEERRLNRYYKPRQKQVEDWLRRQPDN